MGALSTYIYQAQDLLHDSLGRYWSTTQLTNYVNEGRNRVAADSKCLRQILTSGVLSSGVETYNYSYLAALPACPAGSTIVALLGVTTYWGTQRQKLMDWSFTSLDARLRYLQMYKDVPVAFARMGGSQFYVAPTPNQDYTADFDVSMTPAPLVTDSTPEQLPVPYQIPVQFYVAYKAKFNEQSLGESDIYFKEYRKHLLMANAVYMPRVIPNPY